MKLGCLFAEQYTLPYMARKQHRQRLKELEHALNLKICYVFNPYLFLTIERFIVQSKEI